MPEVHLWFEDPVSQRWLEMYTQVFTTTPKYLPSVDTR